MIGKNAKRFLIFQSRSLDNDPPVKFIKYELLQFCVKVAIHVFPGRGPDHRLSFGSAHGLT